MKHNIPNNKKIILDLCGGSGAWSAPYKEAGYDVRVITLPDYNVLNTEFREDGILFPTPLRIQGHIHYEDIYGILAAPPCDQFSFAKTTGKPRDLERGFKVVKACLEIIWQVQMKLKSPYAKETPLKFWALENPNGLLKRFLGRPVFEFNPYDFGDQYQKNTNLWGYFNFPIKKPIELTKEQKELHKTNSQPLAKYMKFDRLKTKEIHPAYYGKLDRTARRAITPKGFAEAFFRSNK